MEFRVFTQDPTPDYTSPVTLDLQALGFHPGQQIKVTEMWGGNDMGTFKDSEFKPVLKAHESGLYRLTRLDRSGDASVSLSIPAGEHPADEAFEVTVTIAGVPASAPAAASDDQPALHAVLHPQWSGRFLLRSDAPINGLHPPVRPDEIS